MVDNKYSSQFDRLLSIEKRLSEIVELNNKLTEELKEKLMTPPTFKSSTVTSVKISSKVDSSIILKNFPTKPEPKSVINSFCNLFKVKENAIKDFYVQSSANSKNNNVSSHQVVISFKNHNTKVSVFKEKTKRSLHASQFMPGLKVGKNQTINCTHNYSNFNLFVQRSLYRLHSNKLISAYRYRDAMFFVQLNGSEGWAAVDGYRKLRMITRQLQNKVVSTFYSN